MNYLSAIFILAFITSGLSSFGQQVQETSFAIGINKNHYAEAQQLYNEELPAYLILSGSNSWYSNDHRYSLKKEAGLNFQYAPIGIISGGLGASDKYSGGIASLFANVSLQPRVRISESLAFSAGPEAEILLIGYSNIDHEYYSMIYENPIYGNKKISGINRDYFNRPSFGIKASLMESNPDSKISVGLNFSYLWTKSEPSNFYAENYTRFSLVIGFKKQKEEVTVEPAN